MIELEDKEKIFLKEKENKNKFRLKLKNNNLGKYEKLIRKKENKIKEIEEDLIRIKSQSEITDTKMKVN